MRLARASVGCLLVTLVLGGCAEPMGIREAGKDPAIFVNRSRSGDDVLAGGWLRSFDDGACLVLANGESSVMVWPRGSRAVSRGGEFVGVRVPGSGLIRPDTRIIGAGGFRTIGASSMELPEVPAACPSDVVYFVVLWRVSPAD